MTKIESGEGFGLIYRNAASNLTRKEFISSDARCDFIDNTSDINIVSFAEPIGYEDLNDDLDSGANAAAIARDYETMRWIAGIDYSELHDIHTNDSI
jgi:hypothetical protein